MPTRVIPLHFAPSIALTQRRAHDGVIPDVDHDWQRQGRKIMVQPRRLDRPSEACVINAVTADRSSLISTCYADAHALPLARRGSATSLEEAGQRLWCGRHIGSAQFGEARTEMGNNARGSLRQRCPRAWLFALAASTKSICGGTFTDRPRSRPVF